MDSSQGISIGVFGYKERENFDNFLDSFIYNINLLDSSLRLEIFFIFDELSPTNKEEIILKLKRIHLSNYIFINNPCRVGKINAINLFLKKSKYNACILCNADTIIGKGVFKRLIHLLLDGPPSVGMVGARVLPYGLDNIPSSVLKKVIAILWDLHHILSLTKPKLSEVIGFKKIFRELPQVGLDDVIMEEYIVGNGYKMVYIPSVCVYTRVPSSWKDYFLQRRRISAQYTRYLLRRRFFPSTRNVNVWLKSFKNRHLKWSQLIGIILLWFIEMYVFILGLITCIKNEDLIRWQISETTKS